MRDMKLKKTLVLALFTAAALIIYIVESQIPVLIAVPGIKLGLSNVIVLVTLYFYGRKEAAAVLILKIVLGSVFSGQLMGFLYSAAGGVLCLLIMMLLKPFLNGRQIWAVSAFGAISFNIGQLTAAILIMGSGKLLWYAPVLLISGIITGVFTGVCAQLVLPRIRKALKADGK
jgi:Predicted membrane protein